MAQMKRLSENARPLRPELLVLQRDRGKAGNEHDANSRLSRRTRRANSIPSIPGMTTSASSRSYSLLRDALEGGFAVADRIDRMPGTPQTPIEKRAHLVVVFGKENTRHR